MNMMKRIIGFGVLGVLMFADCSGMDNLAKNQENYQPDLSPIVDLWYYPGRAAINNDVSFFHALFPLEQRSNPVYVIGSVNDDDYTHTLWECNAIYIPEDRDFRAYLSVYLNLDDADERILRTAYSKRVDIDMASELPIVKISYGTHISHYTRPTNQDELYNDLRGDLDFRIPWFIMRHVWGDGFYPDNI